jgi:DNA-binding transcriptional LysR family regulator
VNIELARTFLEIARSGSLIAAARSLNITQTAVTARIKLLEGQLACRLFVRNRAGARLTAEGERFTAYALQLIQTWEAARRDLPLPQGHGTLLSIGGEVSLSSPLMLHWVMRLRESNPGQAVRAEVGDGDTLQRKLEAGALDAALVYRPEYWPGMQVEQLLEEKLIQVASALNPEPYVYVDWGADFRRQHDTALPEHAKAAVYFSLGPLALQYLLQRGGRGYFRTRVAQHYLAEGLLHAVPGAPEFSYPVYLVYARKKSSAGLEAALDILRGMARETSDWSQRWEPEA